MIARAQGSVPPQWSYPTGCTRHHRTCHPRPRHLCLARCRGRRSTRTRPSTASSGDASRGRTVLRLGSLGASPSCRSRSPRGGTSSCRRGLRQRDQRGRALRRPSMFINPDLTVHLWRDRSGSGSGPTLDPHLRQRHRHVRGGAVGPGRPGGPGLQSTAARPFRAPRRSAAVSRWWSWSRLAVGLHVDDEVLVASTFQGNCWRPWPLTGRSRQAQLARLPLGSSVLVGALEHLALLVPGRKHPSAAPGAIAGTRPRIWGRRRSGSRRWAGPGRGPTRR